MGFVHVQVAASTRYRCVSWFSVIRWSRPCSKEQRLHKQKSSSAAPARHRAYSLNGMRMYYELHMNVLNFGTLTSQVSFKPRGCTTARIQSPLISQNINTDITTMMRQRGPESIKLRSPLKACMSDFRCRDFRIKIQMTVGNANNCHESALFQVRSALHFFVEITVEFGISSMDHSLIFKPIHIRFCYDTKLPLSD